MHESRPDVVGHMIAIEQWDLESVIVCTKI